MKNDYIQINDTDFRIEFNWNALSDFLENQNIELSDVDKIENLKPHQVTALIYFAVKEGARMEQKDFPFDMRDFGAKLNQTDLADLLVVYRRQSQVKSKVSNTKKKLFPMKN